MATHQTLNLSDIQLSYWEWNQGKEPLLLLHGLANHALVWTSLAEYLCDRYHIVAVDMRGHGDSSKPKTGYTFKEAIADLEALLEHLGWQSTHIVAHSWCGKLAPIWAVKSPHIIRSMVLVDPIFITKMPAAMKITFPILYRVLPSLKEIEPVPTYEAAENRAKTLPLYQGWSLEQQQIFQAGIEQKPDGTWASKCTIAARNEIFEEVMRVPGLTEPIQIPTLFIQPEKGVNRMEWQLKPYKTYLKNLRICQAPGNHWPFLVEPAAFNRIVAEFLAEQE
jgi:haloacetate dehalogenase